MALSTEDLEKALVRADSLAEQGDKQAYEDARILAKEYARRKEEASIKERVGGANPVVDPARSDTLLGKTKAALNFVPAFVEGNVRGAAGMIGQVMAGAPAGGIEALGRMAIGQGADKAVEEGIKTMTTVSDKARNLFGILPKDDIFGGAKAVEDAVGEFFGKAPPIAAKAVEKVVQTNPAVNMVKAMSSPETAASIDNLAYTGGESLANAVMLGAGVFPLAGARRGQLRAREAAKGEAERQRVLEEQARQDAAREAERIKILEQRSTQGGEVPFTQVTPEPYLGPDVPNKVPRGRNVPEIAEDIIGDRPIGRTYDEVPEGRLPGYTRRDADVPIDDSAAPPRSREGGAPLPYEQTSLPRGDQAFPDPRTRDLAASEADVARARQETQGLLDNSRLPFERTAIPEPDQGLPPGVRRNERGERAIDFEPMAGEDIASRAIAGERAAIERQRRITEAEGIPFEAQPNWREAVRRAEEQAARASEVVATISGISRGALRLFWGDRFLGRENMPGEPQYGRTIRNPVTLRDGTRLDGFTDMAQTTFSGYDSTGQRITIRRTYVNPEDIVFSRDSNRTANALKKALEGLNKPDASLGAKDPAWAPFQAYGRVVEQMAKGVSDASQLIRVLANDKSLNVIERSVARMVSKALEGAGVRMEIVSNADMGRIVPDAVKRLGDTPAGLWQSTEGRILLNQQKPLTHRDLLHEGIHAVLADWQKVFPNSMESRAIRKTYDIARRELTKTRSWDDIRRDPDMYGMTNEREFVAEVMGNQAFREKLDKILLSPADRMHLNALMSQIKSGNKHFSPIRTAWDAFIRTANTLLGREVPDHALSKVAFEAGATAVKSIGKAETLKDTRQMFRNGDVVTDHLNAMIDRASKTTEQPKVGRPTANSIIDASVGETRPLEQFMKDIGGKVADLPDNFSNLWIKGLRSLSDITQVYRATGNPFLKYVYEFASNARHEAQLRAEIAKEGTYFSVGKRNPQKLTDPNAPIPRMSVLRRTSPVQYQKMVDIWNEFGGKSKPSRDEMLARGLTTSTIDTIEAVHKSLQSAWKDLNAQRVALGKEPIPEIPFYHPVYFGEGSWMARIRGKDGSTMWFHRFHSKAEADQAAAMFNQKLREKGVTDGVIQPTARMDRELRGSKYNISPVVLEDILSVMEAGDKRRKVINDLVAEIKGKGGFGSHFAKRQGVKGGDLTAKNIQRVYEEYMDGLYNYMGNMEISKLKRDVSMMANQETLPRGIAAYAIDYLDRTRGVNTGAFKATEGFLNDLWEGIGGTRLPGNPDIRRAIDASNKMFMVTKLMIGNLGFTIGNMFQYATFGHANLLHMKNLGFNKGSATKSYYKGLHDMFQKEGDFAKYRDEYAVPRGSIDPSFMQEEFGMGNKVAIGKFEVDLKQISDWGLMMIAPRKAEQLSRLQAHAAAFDFAKDNGFKGKELYSTAETIANSIMVDYNKAARPKVLDDLGVVGVASKPLWTFANYYWSTLGTFTRDAVQGMASGNFAKAAPLASLMVTTTLYAGLTGSVAWHVIDKIWDFLRTTAVMKKAFPEGSRVSFTEWMLGNMPDTVLFGALDSATKLVDPRGMHIAGGLASPEPKIPGLLGGSESPFAEKPMQWAPGIQHTLDMSEALYSAFMDAVGAKDYTSAEIRKKLKAPAPSSFGRFFDLLDFQSFSEAQFRDEGMPRPSASPRGYAGPVTDQDTFERGVHVAFGNTLRQEKELMAFREAKEFSGELSEDRQKIVDLMVDNIMFGKGDWDKYVEKAIQLGYKPSELRTALREAYKARVLEEDTRRQGRGGSTARNEETRRRLEMQQ